MKTYENKARTKRIWYDAHLRLWTMQNLDINGNQINGVDYVASRIYAFNWLNEINN